jgi:hypothetical protein
MVTGEQQTADFGVFSKKNPIIRIFCISGWLAVPIIPDKWSCTVICYASPLPAVLL